MIVYYLTWFEKEGEGLLGEALLSGVTTEEVAAIFGDPPHGCFVVSQEHLEWLGEKAKGVRIQLDMFDYFVEDCLD